MLHSGPEPIAYRMEVKGDAKVRGDEPAANGPVLLRPSTQLRIKLEPQKPVRDAVHRVVVVHGAQARIASVPFSTAEGGEITIDAVARAALGEQTDGPAELVILIGAHLPDDAEVLQLARSPGQAAPIGVTILRRAILFEEWEATLRNDPGEIEVAGCEAVTAGPVCEVKGRSTLRFWVPVSKGMISARIDGRAADAGREAGENGTRLLLDIPAGAMEIELVGPAGARLFHLPLRPALDVPSLGEAFREMQKNNLDVAERKIDLAQRDDRPAVRLQALRVRARIERRRGNRALAQDLLEQAISRDHASGRLSDEIDDRDLLAYQRMTVDFDFAAAEEQLAATASLEAGCPGLSVDGDYYRGLLAVETGRLDAALRWLGRSSEGAARLGLPEQEAAARQQLIEVLGILGRRAEARALIDRSMKDAAGSTDPCARARLVTSAAWARLRGAESEQDTTDASRTASEAVEIARARCPDALAMSLLNLAFTEAAAKKTSDARAHLAEARKEASPGDRRFLTWSDSLAVELDLTDRPEQALSTLEALRVRGEASFSPELSFEADLGRARALDALGRTKDAASAFFAAAATLDRWSELVRLGEGRDTFFVQQEKGARLWVDFLVRRAEAAPTGSPARAALVRAAADAARRSVGRFFATLARTELLPVGEQGDYRRSRGAADRALAEGKPVPKDAESMLRRAHGDARRTPQSRHGVLDTSPADSAAPLTLLYHPIQGGWVGFALEANGQIHMERLPSFSQEALASAAGAEREALSRALLSPFEAQIDAAKSVRVPAQGPLRRVAFEALPWKGHVLSDAAVVTYGFDADLPLPEASAGVRCNGPSRALLVTNPQGDLRGAERAGPEVAAALRACGWDVRSLTGEAATRERVLAELGDPCTALFHYDGHARFEGRDGLRAALVLRDGTLTVTDVLSLPRVPEAVALVGCSTAKDEGLGLSQAFLVRGAREVLASTEDAGDALSLRIARHLYDAARPAAQGPPVLSAALAGSSAAARAEKVGAEPWWIFRVLAR